jgi:RHS repeat-associated protein
MEKAMIARMQIRGLVLACLSAVASVLPVTATAQSSVRVGLEEDKLINSPNTPTTLGPELFGDEVNLYNGTVKFRQTDISLPGNNSLEVGVSRSFSPKQWAPLAQYFGDWDLEIPHLQGTFVNGSWITQLTPNTARCSQYSAPPTMSGVQGGSFSAVEYWSGNFLVLPGKKGGGEILKSVPNTPTPTDGQSYPLTTRDGVVFRCLNLAGGGEGFEAVAPDGTRYRFDRQSSRRVQDLEKANPLAEGFSAGTAQKSGAMTLTAVDYFVRRYEVWLLPSVITDRFGNTVTYTWNAADSSRLESIIASDGRSLTFTYETGTGHHRIRSVSDGTRVWWYNYVTVPTNSTVKRLASVDLPDSRQWTFNLEGLRNVMMVTPPWGGCTGTGGAGPSSGNGTMTHPSGATGSFTVTATYHGRSWVPWQCQYDLTGTESYNWHPFTVSEPSLTSKAITGTGLSGLTWTYAYSAATACFDSLSVPVSLRCTGSSPTTKDVTVTGPDGKIRYTYGNKWNDNEGLLTQVDEGWDGAGYMRTTYNSYASPTAGPWQDPYATSILPRGTGYNDSRLRPLRSRTITQQGRNFVWNIASTCVNGLTVCFDRFARPTVVDKYSTPTPNVNRNEAVSFWDNTVKWVLGQTAQTTVNGVVAASATYDPTYAAQLTFTSFGKLQQTLSWETSALVPNQLGTIKTVQDGNGNTTTLTNWHRGIPQTTTHADGTVKSAAVDYRGCITQLTDENGNFTDYECDLMSRIIKKIKYPIGGSTNWNDTNSVFEPVAGSEYGIAGMHWRQTTYTGAEFQVTYFDALWRPILTREYDSNNVAGTERAQRFTYSYNGIGEVRFSSYLGGAPPTDPLTTGFTTQYDTLGRVVKVSQTSDLDPLDTVMSYLPDFQTKVTAPKTNYSTTDYLTFDTPSTDSPILIAQPGSGSYTHILRDPLGKPLQVRRNDSSAFSGGSVALDRYFIYHPTYQTLCKTIEPEGGTTVQDYDGAGNVDWIASGLNIAFSTDCSFAAGQGSPRFSDRTYDLRNRLKTVAFTDGRGNQSWFYYADGAPQLVSVNNPPVSGTVDTTYVYNNRGMIENEHLVVQGSAFDLRYEYDGNAHQKSLTYPVSTEYPSGYRLDYVLNALGQIKSITAPDQTYASGVNYYPNGTMSGFTYGNNVPHSLTLNARKLPSQSVDGAGGGIQDLSYAYDLNGNVISVSGTVRGQTKTHGMGYDGMDRLTTVTSNVFGNATYTYDVFDNLRRVQVGASNNRPARDWWYCYDNAWRVTSLDAGGCGVSPQWTMQYDDPGNVTRKGLQYFDFDFGNRLRAAVGLEWYAYDGLGRRVLSCNASVCDWQVYSQEGEPLYSFDYRTGLRYDRIYLNGSLLATRERPVGGGAATFKYQHTDALGSPIAVTNASQTVVEETEYEPYGAQTNRPVTDGPGFIGHVQDSATGLVYMQQRYYDPVVGRFLSVDPVSTDRNTGAHFNRYAYALNNPYAFMDPDGREEEPSPDRDRRRPDPPPPPPPTPPPSTPPPSSPTPTSATQEEYLQEIVVVGIANQSESLGVKEWQILLPPTILYNVMKYNERHIPGLEYIDAMAPVPIPRGMKPIADIAKKIKQFKKKSLRDQKSVYENLKDTYEKHLKKYGTTPGNNSGETNRMERELAEMKEVLESRGVKF